MLVALSIRDFAIVDRLDLEFEPGFTALTGETGAGKSILIDALALALGERADASGRARGRERAEVTPNSRSRICPTCSSGSRRRRSRATPDVCCLRRVVDRSGRSRAFINGTAATAQQLPR